MSVLPPPGAGAAVPNAVDAGTFCVMTRNVWPASTDPNQVLRCVPVPVGPLTKTRPCGSIPMSGSPLVWMGSTTTGTPNAMPGAATAGTVDADAAAIRSAVDTRARGYFGRGITDLLVFALQGVTQV